MKIIIPLKIESELLAFFFIVMVIIFGCKMPVSESESTKANARNLDSLDAETGKEGLNKYSFNQGNLSSTGEVTDLALEGKGFFVLKNKSQNVYFRRPASFFLDTGGYMVLGLNNTRLQGLPMFNDANPYEEVYPDAVNLDSLGITDLTDIRIPSNAISRPRPTSQIWLARNLDKDSYGVGSIIYSQKFLHSATESDLVIGLCDHAGNSLGLKVGDRLIFSVESDSGTAIQPLILDAGSTLKEIVACITLLLRTPSLNFGSETTVKLVTREQSSELGGAFSIFGNTSVIKNFRVICNRLASSPKVTQAFATPAVIPPGSLILQFTTDTFRSPGKLKDPLSVLYDASGYPLGLENEDQISISGSLGAVPIPPVAVLTVKEGLDGTTLEDILELIMTGFQLPERDGTPEKNRSVDINLVGSDDFIPDGSIVIRGQPESFLAIRDVSIRAIDQNSVKPSPNFFNSNMNMTILRNAVDTKLAESSINIFDASGKEHNLAIRFTPSDQPNQWHWLLQAAGRGKIIKGSKGSLFFGQDGSVERNQIEKGDSLLEVDPGNGAPIIKMQLMMGGPRDFTGVTQFRSPTSLSFVSQNGYGMGRLRQISIGEDGVISGSYTNGLSRSLFRIPLAQFPNRQGLRLIGNNSFLETINSGKPWVQLPGQTSFALIKPGAIEQNPD
jgi:flagellar hook protein FlgE